MSLFPYALFCSFSLKLPRGQHPIKKWVLSIPKKDKMLDGAPRRLCKYHPSLNGADFCGGGWVISGLLVDGFGSWFGTNTKLLHGVMGPISTPNDYLNTVFDDAVSLHGSCKTMPSHGSTGKVSTCSSSLSTLVLLLTGGDGSFTALKKMIDSEWKHLNLDLLLCFYIKKLCILKNVMSQKHVKVWLKPNINKGYFWKNVHIFVANLFMSNFRNHLIIAAFLPIPLP